MSTLACVAIFVHDPVQARADAVRAAEFGADLVEFRIDPFVDGKLSIADFANTLEQIEQLIADAPVPCIVTCRIADEGGLFEGDDTERVSLFEHLGTSNTPPTYIDVELQTYETSANIRQKIGLAVDHPAQQRAVATRLVLSTHDFQTRPHNLLRRVLSIADAPACAVAKFAFRARTIRDTLDVFDLLRSSPKPTIGLAMGEHGQMSRILAPKFGAFLTFASLDDTQETAPGQISIDTLLNVYRFRSITHTTRIYGIVGWPVEHSLSPHVHNAGFDAIDHDGVYVPMPIESHTDGEDSWLSFKATMLDMVDSPLLDLAGMSVTLPHKQRLAALAHEQGWNIDDASTEIGAANTVSIARHADGVTQVDVVNTDAPAARMCLEHQLGELTNANIFILGAGGVARGIAWACAHAGAHVHICARRHEQAHKLAESLTKTKTNTPISTITLKDTNARAWDAVINCTPVGMAGGPDPDGVPIDLDTISVQQQGTKPVIFDTIYAPTRTPWIAHAQSMGLCTITGDKMFLTQASLQFEIWTGQPPPEGVFERAIAHEHRKGATL